MAVNLTLEGYTEKDIIDKVVAGIRKDILSQKKYWGEVPEEGHYSDFDKFKNQIAQLVATMIYEDMVDNDEISKRSELAYQKAEKAIFGRMNKKISI